MVGLGKASKPLIPLIYLFYSRAQTFEADKAGTTLIAKAGYNPAAILFLNEVHDKYRVYSPKAPRIYIGAPNCSERQAVAFPVIRDWKVLSTKA